MKLLSKYKNHVTASKKQVYLTNIADYFLSFILTFLLFAVAGGPIVSALPSTQEGYAAAAAHTKKTYEIIAATRLQSLNEKGGLNDLAVDGKEYILTLAKTSYYLSGDKFPSKNPDGSYSEAPVEEADTFLNSQSGQYPNDRISYFYLTFKAKEASLNSYVYDGVDYSANKEDYLYKKAFGYTEERFAKVDERLPLYQQLKKDQAVLVTSYLVYSDATETPRKAYEGLLESYRQAASTLIHEVETKYEPYLEENRRFQEVIAAYDATIIVSYTLCFLAGFLILEGVLPLIFKEGRTLSCLAIKVSYATMDEENPSWWRFLLKSLSRLPIHYSGVFFCFLLTGMTSLSFVSYGFFNLAMLFLLGAILGIGSLIMVAAGRDNRGLPEIISGLIVKDINQMEGGVPLEERKGGDDGFVAGELKP